MKLAIQMCKRLVEIGVPALHFYTLNLEKSVARTLEGLNLIEENIQRPLPWQMVRRGVIYIEDSIYLYILFNH